MKHIVNTDNAPAPIGPYNQAVKTGHLLYTSGQIPIDPATGIMVDGGIREQSIQVMENLKAVLEEAGATFEDVIKTTVFLSDMADFPVLNEVYGEYFVESNAPARSTIAVAGLPKGSLVEIELIAKV